MHKKRSLENSGSAEDQRHLRRIVPPRDNSLSAELLVAGKILEANLVDYHSHAIALKTTPKIRTEIESAKIDRIRIKYGSKEVLDIEEPEIIRKNDWTLTTAASLWTEILFWASIMRKYAWSFSVAARILSNPTLCRSCFIRNVAWSLTVAESFLANACLRWTHMKKCVIDLAA